MEVRAPAERQPVRGARYGHEPDLYGRVRVILMPARRKVTFSCLSVPPPIVSGAVRQMAPLPIVVRAIPVSIANTGSACITAITPKTCSLPRPATIDAPVAGIVTIHKLAAFPVLIAPVAAAVIATCEHI